MAEPARTIALVACVGRKLDHPAAAKDLYKSDWFKKASSYARSVTKAWYILSAEYGLVHPDQVIEPYNKTLNEMSSRERRAWAAGVIPEVGKVVNRGDRIVMLAGARYRELLIEPLHELGCSVEVPMKGMLIGKQLQWLNKQFALSHAR